MFGRGFSFPMPANNHFGIVTARGPFEPDRICDTVAKGYCSVAGTVAAAQYFPVSLIPETEREADQVK